jgi:hypothetical protein
MRYAKERGNWLVTACAATAATCGFVDTCEQPRMSARSPSKIKQWTTLCEISLM